MNGLQRYPDSRVLSPSVPSPSNLNGPWLRAAPRLQWRDRAGIEPASRAQTLGG